MKRPASKSNGTKQDLLTRPISDIQLKANMSVRDLMGQIARMGGFSSTVLTEGLEIMEDMMNDVTCTRFLSFTANLVATGLRGALAGLIRKGRISLIITTGGAIDHDIARSSGKEYYSGRFEADDTMLEGMKIHRLGNVFIPINNYGPPIEKATYRILDEITTQSNDMAPHELLRRVGERTKDPNSILAAAAHANVPIIVPGITDSAFGTNIFVYAETHRFRINVLQDMKLISEAVYNSDQTGAIILGGGISKHHALWWNQFKGGLDYAVSITTAPEYDGSLSGARLSEAITWGKLKPKARNVTIDGDATILFPFMLAELYNRLERGKKRRITS